MSEKKLERRGLGRGLSALMADVNMTSAPVGQGAEPPRRADFRLPVEKLIPNPNQPRRDFIKASLDELAASIREKGVIQPLIVREQPGGTYEIVAGERRWRAAQLAQVHDVPVIVRQFDDTEVLEVAIIENIQRADLNPIEEAMAFKQLMERFGHTQEKLAEALSKSRSHIANLLRLLNLPKEVVDHVREGRMSAGHARALITGDDPVALAKQVIDRGLSVRETERLAKGRPEPVAPEGTQATVKRPASMDKDADTRVLEQDLSASIGMRVQINHKGSGGDLTISYRDLDQLDQLCRMLSTMR